jgi:hypothetical protein
MRKPPSNWANSLAASLRLGLVISNHLQLLIYGWRN